MAPTHPSVYEHYRATVTDYKDGTYRVVGVGDDTVTLLRVGNSDGRRINTGELITVSTDEIEEFERTDNPDGNRRLSNVLFSVPETAYWSVLAFVKELSSHPIQTSVAIALVLVGSLGESVLPLPEAVLSLLIIVGSLSLAYVGSGRM